MQQRKCKFKKKEKELHLLKEREQEGAYII